MLRAHISASVLDMDHDGPNSRVAEKRGLDDWHRIGSSQQAQTRALRWSAKSTAKLYA